MLEIGTSGTVRGEDRNILTYSALRLEWRGQDGQSEAEQPDHPASLGDSITASYSDEVFGTHNRRACSGRGSIGVNGLGRLRSFCGGTSTDENAGSTEIYGEILARRFAPWR
jgi:hypothetical protein